MSEHDPPLIPAVAANEPRPIEPIVPVTPPNLPDAAEMLWTVLANVSGGDWSKQTREWQYAASVWRDYYFAALKVGVDPSAQRRVIQCEDQVDGASAPARSTASFASAETETLPNVDDDHICAGCGNVDYECKCDDPN